jgi:hypothetical protein
MNPKIAEPQITCVDKGKGIVISENANIKSAESVKKHFNKRSLSTCHHCGTSGHIRPHCP